jgi:hypothetical protein
MAKAYADSVYSLESNFTTKSAALTFDEILVNIDNDKKASEPPYSAFTPGRRALILAIVTVAGFFGPLCGAVYLPSLELFQQIYNSSATVINATVAVYQVVFAIVVCVPLVCCLPEEK